MDRDTVAAFEQTVAAFEQTVASFEQTVASFEHIVRAERLFGDPDYLLRVLTRDMAAFQRLYDDELAALPGVQRLSSILVMESVVVDRPLRL